MLPTRSHSIISSALVDINGDGTAGDENGDGVVNEADRKVLPATDLVARAHARGLLVHPYTFRNEGKRLAFDYGGNPINEYLRFYEAGSTGCSPTSPTRPSRPASCSG